MDLDTKSDKSGPRGKNVNLVQVSLTKKNMFAIFQTFKILQIDP